MVVKVCILSLTTEGHVLAEKLKENLEGATHFPATGKVAHLLAGVWASYDAFVCVMAAGIVVRSIAPLLQDKLKDPCVIVMDQQGKHVISLLSGHIGGGNQLASSLARITGGTAVITTASDVSGKTSLDLWAQSNDLLITDRKKLTRVTAKLVNGGTVNISNARVMRRLPAELLQVEKDDVDIVISFQPQQTLEPLHCIPRLLYLGIGCNRGTPLADIERCFLEMCTRFQLLPEAFAGLATINVKSDEKGIRSFAQKHQLGESFFTPEQLNSVENVSSSEAVLKAVGAKGVAEPAALLAAKADGEAELIIPKLKWRDVTLAVAERIKELWD